TRILVPAKVQGSNTGATYVQLRSVNLGLPTDVSLQQFTMQESSLGSAYAWQQFTPTSPPSYTPGTALCLVLQVMSGSPSCAVPYQALTVSTNMYMVDTILGGIAWLSVPTQSMLFQVYGTVTAPSPQTYQYNLWNVRCVLRTGASTTSRINSGTAV